MVEINQLAIVNMQGMDKDLKTGKLIFYYQIVNPVGIAKQRGGGIKSPVYSYRIDGFSPPQIEERANQIIPRVLFPDQKQAIIVTEELARRGLGEIINFFERQYNRRGSVYLLVTNSPMDEVMNTFTPLEKLTGLALHSMIEIQSKQYGSVSKKSRIKDLAENMDSSALTVMPLISLAGSKQAQTTDRYELINANQGNIIFTGGAIFKHDRMIGKLKFSQVSLYNLLKDQTGVLSQTLMINQGKVNIRAKDTSVRRHLSIVSGQPLLKLDIKTKINIINDQNMKLTLDSMSKIKKKFNQQLKDKVNEFYEEGRKEGWDLLGIKEQIKHKREKKWEEAKKDENIWQRAKIDLTLTSEVTDIGSISDPYKGE